MTLIADILMVAGALGAALYCMVLSRRLSKFNDLEKGVGGAVAVLSAQVDDLSKTLSRAEVAALDSGTKLKEITQKSEEASERLELLMAAMHDVPIDAPAPVEEPVAAFKSAQAKEVQADTMFFRHRSNLEEAV